MGIPDLIRESRSLWDWIQDKLDGLKVGSDRRSTLAAACFSTTLEHHRAIVELVALKLNGSAWALARPMYESILRGLWIHHCATESQIEKIFEKDNFDLKLCKLRAEVEEKLHWQEGSIPGGKQISQNALNSFAHTGAFQLERRVSPFHIETSYTDEELLQLLRFSGQMAILSGISAAGVAKANDIASLISARAEVFMEVT